MGIWEGERDKGRWGWEMGGVDVLVCVVELGLVFWWDWIEAGEFVGCDFLVGCFGFCYPRAGTDLFWPIVAQIDTP